ncbi:unnamed protein product [Caenorhabditis bovis]|uniref:Uncharacterized protein n=1 Tax=Caenorhabditis bovis TaxID=2654633 RepID=A0A8S1FDC8_9PELO|nr:unnamed protein product [Caenorhabditis bovis]
MKSVYFLLLLSFIVAINARKVSDEEYRSPLERKPAPPPATFSNGVNGVRINVEILPQHTDGDDSDSSEHHVRKSRKHKMRFVRD